MKRIASLTFVMCWLLWAPAAPGDDFAWTGATSTRWAEGTNWDPVGPPSSADNANFSGAGGTVELDASAAVHDVNISAGAWTFDGAAYALAVNGRFLQGAASGTTDFEPALVGLGSVQVDGGLLVLGSPNNAWDATEITGGTLQVGSEDGAAALGSGTIAVHAAGTLRFRKGFSGSQHIVLNGGALDRSTADVYVTLSGIVELRADSTILGSPMYRETPMILSGLIHGPGRFTYDGRDQADGSRQGMPFRITHAGNSYSGGTRVQSGKLEAVAAGALGSGTVIVDASDWRDVNHGWNGYYGGLVVFADQPSVPAIVVNPEGTLALNADDPDPAGLWHTGWDEHLSTPIVLNGGALCGSRSFWAYPEGTTYVDGGVTLTADSHLRIKSGEVVIDSPIGESGGSRKLIKDFEDGAATLSVANHYSGGTDVLLGQLNVNAPGALGSGPVYVADGGVLRTNAAGALASVPAVVVGDAGTLDLNSTEDSARALIKPGGRFRVSGGATMLDYTPGSGNVNVEAGAVLDQNLPRFPTLGQLLPGDGGYGCFIGAVSGHWLVGSTSGTIFRGLGADRDATFSGSVTEAAGGTGGVGMLAAGAARFTYQGATFATDGSNTLKLHGSGGHVIDGTANSFSNDLEMLGTGMVQVDDADGIRGRTLTVRSGWLDLDDPDALRQAVVDLDGPADPYAGGVLRLDRQASTGRVNVAAGAAAQLWGEYFLIREDLAGGADWNFQPGSQLVFSTTDWAAGMGDVTPAQGRASFLFQGTDSRGLELVLSRLPPLNGGRLELAEATRITLTGVPGQGFYDHRIGRVEEEVVLGAGQSSGRIAAPTDLVLAVAARVDFGSGTLIAGDPGVFHAARLDGAGFWDIGQDGQVRLENPGNVIGQISVQAGTLRVDEAAGLGGASTVGIASGAVLQLDLDDPSLSTRLTGGGSVLVGQNASGTGILALTPSPATDAGVDPGGGTGVLTLAGSLAFGKLDAEPPAGEPWKRSFLRIELTGAGGVPGIDHDQLAVAGSVTGLSEAALHVEVDPSLSPPDLSGRALTILTCWNDLTGRTFGEVHWPAGWSGQVVCGDGQVRLSNIVPEPSGLCLFALCLLVRRRRACSFRRVRQDPPGGACSARAAGGWPGGRAVL